MEDNSHSLPWQSRAEVVVTHALSPAACREKWFIQKKHRPSWQAAETRTHHPVGVTDLLGEGAIYKSTLQIKGGKKNHLPVEDILLINVQVCLINESGVSYKQLHPCLQSVWAFSRSWNTNVNFSESDTLLTVIFPLSGNAGWPQAQHLGTGEEVRYQHRQSKSVGHH